jgi:predicted chitinase
LTEDTSYSAQRALDVPLGRFKGKTVAFVQQYIDGTAGTGATSGERLLNYAYADKDGNGNEASGDGYLYRGRGLLQITRKGKYERITNGGHRAGGNGEVIPSLNDIYGTNIDFVAHPELAAEIVNAARSSAGYWRYESARGNLNTHADNNDFNRTVRGIHGNTSADEMRNRNSHLADANKVISNQNAYVNLNTMLSALGIHAWQSEGYNTKFGLALNSQTPVSITGSKNLEAAGVLPLNDDAQNPALQTLVDDFNVNLEELDMLLFDALPQEAPVVIVAQAKTQTRSDGLYGVVGSCVAVARSEYNEYLDIEYPREIPLTVGDDAMRLFDFRGEYDLFDSAELLIKATESDAMTVIEYPKHGVLEEKLGGLVYKPDQNYIGKDQAIFTVEFEGYRIKVIYYIHVTGNNVKIEGTPPVEFGRFWKKYCPRNTWEISSVFTNSDSASWYRSASLQALLTDAKDALTGFSDLSGASLGQTTGDKITLDSDAASHSWFIDYTPYINEEWLPTSNPYEWQAKPGSDAEGKMDLLSVLLHEYGHVLGLEHSTDAHDFMATTLQPGVRRLPSAEELQLMANLVGELKGEMGLASTSGQPESPLPANPLPASVGLAAFLASRQRRTTETSGTETLATQLTQYETAANPKLTNASFENGSGWSTSGDVAFTEGAALLKETATTQTRLNQVFVLGENDRILSFTLSGIALDDVDNAPDDAFEVALIDANTGQSLLGSTGLTRNDAVLNLQANGTEYKAAEVTTTRNDDGSLTVQIDLNGIAAGTVVNLSYDLIGFGRGAQAESSQVRVNALRLGAADPGTNPGTEPSEPDPGWQDPALRPPELGGPSEGQADAQTPPLWNLPDGRFPGLGLAETGSDTGIPWIGLSPWPLDDFAALESLGPGRLADPRPARRRTGQEGATHSSQAFRRRRNDRDQRSIPPLSP